MLWVRWTVAGDGPGEPRRAPPTPFCQSWRVCVPSGGTAYSPLAAGKVQRQAGPQPLGSQMRTVPSAEQEARRWATPLKARPHTASLWPSRTWLSTLGSAGSQCVYHLCQHGDPQQPATEAIRWAKGQRSLAHSP